MGGVGATFCARGGGGGGGWFGGGGGGGLFGCCTGGAGGGGGSSYGGAGPSAGITITTAASTQAPEVTITYTADLSGLTTTLVNDSSGKGPGHALADKAAAIQEAVSGGQYATACMELSNYLGLIKAQTGRKLTIDQANLLTGDATNLAAALGC